MHVLILPSEEFIPSYAPTAGIFQYHQAKILSEAGHKIGVISVSQSFSFPMLLKAFCYKIFGKRLNNATEQLSKKEILQLAYRKTFQLEYFLRKEALDGINIFRIDGFFYKPPRDHKNDYGWIKAGLFAYKNYVQVNGAPDIIHAHNAIYAGMLARAIKKNYKIPFVLTEHSTAYAQDLVTNKKVLQRVRSVYTSAKALFAVSSPFCLLLNRKFSFNKFQSLPNVLDAYLEGKEVQINANQKEEFVFLNIAELHPKKDHLTLLKAFKKVYKQKPSARLWIGGDGILRSELERFVEDEGLTSVIIFFGSLNRDGVHKAIVQSDCFVLSSRFETFGVVVIEAMLFGKPAIVTKCGGPESFVDERTGLIVNKEDEQGLAEAMIEMINTYKNYQPEAIRNFALQNFGKEKFVERVDKIYSEAV